MKLPISALAFVLLVSACSSGQADLLSADSDSSDLTSAEVILLGDGMTYDFHYNADVLHLLGNPDESTVRFQLPEGGTIHLNTLPLAQSDVESKVSTLETWGDHEVYRYQEDLDQPGCRREFATHIAGDEVLMAELTLCAIDNQRDAMKALESLFTHLDISGEEKGSYSL